MISMIPIWIDVLDGVAAFRADVNVPTLFVIDNRLEMSLRVNWAVREDLVRHTQG
jgi:hypothetical protein